jgi:peptidoglycan/LPS O-acetylase OafA/YrhL
MTTPSEQSEKTGSFPLFDWLRFVLASMVALAHGDILTWSQAGNFAVQVFFALSGWLIGGILLRTELRGLPRFYYNRGTRIWIPYVLAVATIYLLSALREPVTSHYFHCLFYDLTFTHNWFIEKIPAVVSLMPLQGTGSHFWSISVEEQFYLAAPLLIVLLPFGLGRLVAFWVVVAIAANASHSWYGAISLGVLAAVARSHYGDWQLTRWGMAVVAVPAAALAVAMVTLPDFYWLLAPLLAIGIVLLTSRQGSRGAVGRFVGGMSYPLYLYHWVGIFAASFLVKHLSVPLPSIGWTAYVFALVAGSAAYLMVDQNVMKWRAALFQPAFGKTLMIIAYSLLAAGIFGGAVLRLGV